LKSDMLRKKWRMSKKMAFFDPEKRGLDYNGFGGTVLNPPKEADIIKL